jgi:replicative DNA helicase
MNFYIGKNKVIWKAITDLARAHTSVDFVTLTERLESSVSSMRLVEQQDLTAYLSDTTYSSYNAKDYAAIVRDKRAGGQSPGCY